MRTGHAAADPQVAKGLKYLEQYAQADGGVYVPRNRIPIYETCIALVCFKEANGDRRYDKIIQAAEKFVRAQQWGEDKGKDKSDLYYGGAGYGGKSRPDLSNTAFLIDALKSCGAGPDDKAVQEALVFVSRCQNLESEHNTTQFAGKVNDGGFYYTCVLGKQDQARETPNGGLRSYGSMTYSGLKSMVYAGVTKDDPRVFRYEAHPVAVMEALSAARPVVGYDVAGNSRELIAEGCGSVACRAARRQRTSPGSLSGPCRLARPQ